MSELRQRSCKPCEGGMPALARERVAQLLGEVRGWTANAEGTSIQREFRFKDYYQTTAFVNAVAWIAHREDHHPDIAFGYNRCTITYSTHAVGGLSDNDFICAAKVDALLGND